LLPEIWCCIVQLMASETATTTLEAAERSDAARLEVYTDGQCPLCRWMRERVERRDRFRKIEWKDFRDPSVQQSTPFTLHELDAEMHARRKGDGRWATGYRAWVEVLRVLPRWRFLAPLLTVWPLTSFGRLFYRWLAKRRYKLFGVPPPCDSEGVCQLHK
jgi:predicted DCC family thiol-disulfide oxidoreductase YuxK